MDIKGNEMKDKFKFDRKNEENFVKTLRFYSEAITGDNAKAHDFIPSDVEDIEKNARDTENRSDDDERDAATKKAEHFMDEVYDKCGELVVQMVEDFKSQGPMNDIALDVVLEYRTDGSYVDEGGFDMFGLANFMYDVMLKRGKTADRGGAGEGDMMNQINSYKGGQ